LNICNKSSKGKNREKMIKKLSILVLALAISLSIASPKLRSEVIFRPSQLISVLSDQFSFLNMGTFSGSESE